MVLSCLTGSPGYCAVNPRSHCGEGCTGLGCEGIRPPAILVAVTGRATRYMVVRRSHRIPLVLRIRLRTSQVLRRQLSIPVWRGLKRPWVRGDPSSRHPRSSIWHVSRCIMVRWSHRFSLVPRMMLSTSKQAWSTAPSTPGPCEGGRYIEWAEVERC